MYFNSAISDIIAYGSNENGSYLKYANGVLICWREYATGNLTGWNTWGGLYLKGIPLGSFPHSFYSKPPVIIKNIRNGYSGWVINNTDDVSSSGWGSATIARPSSGEDTYYTLSLLAIGRWK